MDDYSSAKLKAKYLKVVSGRVILDLDGKGLSRVPDAVTELSEVQGLRLSDNNLTKLPTSIQKLNRLEWLDVNENNLTELPAEIGDLKELRGLSVKNNQLVGLPTSIQKLNMLKWLHLDGNNLTELPAEIGDLKELRGLSVTNNQLVGLPTSIQKLNRLECLHLDGNKVIELPAEIGGLKELKELHVSGNPLTIDAIKFAVKLEKRGLSTDIAAPKEIEARGERAQLVYQRVLRDGAVNVQRARILLIGQDRAGKTSLKKSLIGLPFDPKENSTEGIEVDPSIFEVDVHQVKNWQPIDKSERGLLGCSKDVAQMVVEKLCFQGEEEDAEIHDSGQLNNENYRSGNQVPDPKKEGVSEMTSSEPEHELMIDTTSPPDEITKRVEELIKYVKGEGVIEESVGSIELWDFAGQQLYYASHPVFLTSRAIYILVCNLSKSLHDTAQPCVRQGNHNFTLHNPNGETNLENLLSWLSTVHSITQMRRQIHDEAEGKLPYLRPLVIIVGTHADKPFEDIATMKTKIQEAIAGKEYEGHVVWPIFSIDNSAKLIQRRLKKVFRKDKNIDGIQELRDKIMEVLRQEPYMKERIPVRWLIFEKVLNALLSKKVYHLNLRKLQTYVRDNCFINDEEEFTTMVDFYHDLGIIIKHCSTVIVSTEWLIDLFKQLITIPPFDETEPKVTKLWWEVEVSGVLSMELLHHVFSKFLLKGAAKDDILDLMEQFALIAKFSPSKTDEKYFVPCQLRMPPDSIYAMVPSCSDPCPLYVYFVTGFVPHGLFTRLVSRLVRWCSEAGPAQRPTLYQNGAWFVIGRKIIYDLFLICKKQFIKFFVRQKCHLQNISVEDTSGVAVQLREFVEATLQTLSHDLYLCGVQYEIRVACPYCQLEKCSGHNQMGCTHDDCLHLLELRQGYPLICKKKPEELLTVFGQGKWFSQVPREEVYTPSPDTAQSHPGHSVLKVALLANDWGSSNDSLSTINRTLAIHLAKHANVEVTILVPEFECGEVDKRTARGLNIAIKEVQRLPGFSDPLDWLSFPPKDLDIQVVVGHGAKLGRQAQIIRKSHCCKWMQVVHAEPEELAMYKNYANAIAKGEGKNRAEVELCQIADLVVAVGPKLGEGFSSKLCSFHRDIFQFIPGSFAEFSKTQHAKQDSANFKVLTFGGGDFEDFSLKGYDVAAKAIVELQDSSYRLLFVGAPDGKQDKVAEILLQTGISKNQLTVRSFVLTKERLKELFCEVDVAIMPSRTEGFGLTALEAMSAGLPILVSGNSGFGETLRGLTEGKSVVIDSDDPKEWAKAIDAIRQKPRIQRLEEIRRLREVYEEKFSWKRQCQLLVEKMRNMVYGNGLAQKDKSLVPPKKSTRKGGVSAPSEILARGSLATEVYKRALLEGKSFLRRVPVMFIGQDRTGKTSLKKSLKGETFNPNERSTEGIETDLSYFKVSTDVWRTGKNNKDTEPEPAGFFEHQAAQMIFKSLKNGNADCADAEKRSGDPTTRGTKPSKEVEQTGANSEEPSSSSIGPSPRDFKVVQKAKISPSLTELLEEPSNRRTELSLHDSDVIENAETSSSVTKLSQGPRDSAADPSLQNVKVTERAKTISSEKPTNETESSRQDSKHHLFVPNLPEDVAALVHLLIENNEEFEDEDDIYSVLWDFGGQSIYYTTHPIFLTKEAIYILACDLSRDPYQKAGAPMKTGMYWDIVDTWCNKTNLDYLDFWMSSVYSLVSLNPVGQDAFLPEKLPSVFLVCTHADKPYRSGNPKDLAREIYGRLKGKIYGKLLKGLFVVDNTKSGSVDECRDVIKLREKVLSVAKNLPQMNEAIPLKWLKYEKVLRILSKEGYKWIPIGKARQIAVEECGINGDEQFQTLLNFLHDQRVLIHFNESPELDNMVVLSPQWLIDIFKEVITVKRCEHVEESVEILWSNFEKTGILDEKLLKHAWRSLFDRGENCISLVAIMERFSLLCSWPSDSTTKKYLVPSMLMSPPTDDVLEHLSCVRTPSLFVAFDSGRVPPGLFPRLVLLLHQWSQEEWESDVPPELYSNFAMFHIVPQGTISFIFLLHSSSIEIIFHDGTDAFAQTAGLTYQSDVITSRAIHSQLRYLLEQIRKEFFWLKHMKFEMCVCCPVCSQKGGVKCRSHDMRGCECLHFLSESELRDRPYCNKPGIRGDRTINIKTFEHWFALSDAQGSRIPLKKHEVGERDNKEKCCTSYMEETASQRPASDPPDVIIDQLTKQDLPKRSTRLDDCQLPVDILLLTVEDCEFLSCLSYLNPGFCKTFRSHLGIVYLGDIGKDERKLNIAVMSCHGGSASPGGSMVVVLNAVNTLRPKAVFGVGSCRSLDYNNVKLGDIIMSEKLITHGPCRITEGGIEERGVKVPLKSRLLKVIRRAGDGWKPPLKDPKALEVKIHRGTILSGPVEVIDSPKHCKALIDRFPEAVAMEEEGEGVFAAAHDLDIEWIVIKGISDYAGGGKSEETSWRPFASLMAASVTAHFLSDAIIFQDWPHFKSTSGEKSHMKRDAQIPWGRWFDERNTKVLVAGLVCLIAVVLFFCLGSN